MQRLRDAAGRHVLKEGPLPGYLYSAAFFCPPLMKLPVSHTITHDLVCLCGRKATTTTRLDQWWLWGGEARRGRIDWQTLRTPEQSTHGAPATKIMHHIDCLFQDVGGFVANSGRLRSVLDPGFAWQPGKTLKIEVGSRVAGRLPLWRNRSVRRCFAEQERSWFGCGGDLKALVAVRA